MYDDVLRAACDELCKRFSDVGMSNLQKRGRDEREATVLLNTLRGLAQIFVRLLAPAPVSDDQHSISVEFAHYSLSGCLWRVTTKDHREFLSVLWLYKGRNGVNFFTIACWQTPQNGWLMLRMRQSYSGRKTLQW